MWIGAFPEEGSRCVPQMIPWVELQQQQTLGGDRGISSTSCFICKMDLKMEVQQLGEGHSTSSLGLHTEPEATQASFG